MSPDQIALAIKLAIAAAVLSVAFGGGWAVNGWRLGTQLEHAKAQRDQAIAQGTVLAEGVKSCSAGVDRLAKSSEAAIVHTQKLLEEAKRLRNGGANQVKKIEELLAKKPPAGAGCEDAWRELEEIFRKAGAAS